MIVKDPLCEMPIDPEKTAFKIETLGRIHCFCSEQCMHRFIEAPRIAYLSMEVGIKNEIHTYSGGLGVLAGDTIRSSADLRVPLIAVTLVSRKGYLKQKLTEDGQQIEHPDEWNPSKFMDSASAESNVLIEGRNVKINAWIYDYQSANGGVVPIIFLDTDVEGNSVEDRRLTDYLYGGDDRYRLKQEIILGIGGVRMLKALGFNIKSYHMNEGHSSLLTLELLEENDVNVKKVRNLCIFTTHTPVESAFDKFSYNLVQEMLQDEFPAFMDFLPEYGGQDKLNMTLLALNLSRYENGVTKAHMEYSRKLFPGHHIQAITNGVHSYKWTCPHFRELFDRHINGWANEPELLVRIDEVSEEEIWDAHLKAKKDLLDFVKEKTRMEMDHSKLTIGFARRATTYKRANLIFSDLIRLREANRKGGFQMVFAGKAHPKDESGKQVIKEIYRYKALLKNDVKIVYLENHDMDMAAKLTSGVDVWLNTPLPPYEASGTSGMKAAHNGVVNFSVLDGWWIEGCVEDITGWSIGPSPNEEVREEERRTKEMEDLYFKLDYIVIPTFYERRDKWIQMMKNSISKVAYYFNSHRMMRRYITEAYL